MISTESQQKIISKALMGNVAKCGDHIEAIFQYIVERGYRPKTAFIRINRFDLFDIMVCVPGKDFWDDGFIEVYDYAAKLEDKVEDSGEGFSVEFSFLGFYNGYDEDAISSDGFILEYRGRHEA